MSPSREPHIAVPSHKLNKIFESHLPTEQEMHARMNDDIVPEGTIDAAVLLIGDRRFTVLLRGKNMADMLSRTSSCFPLVRSALEEMCGLYERDENPHETNIAIRRARNEDFGSSECSFPTKKGTPCKNRVKHGCAGCRHHNDSMTRLTSRERAMLAHLTTYVENALIDHLWRPHGKASKLVVQKSENMTNIPLNL